MDYHKGNVEKTFPYFVFNMSVFFQSKTERENIHEMSELQKSIKAGIINLSLPEIFVYFALSFDKDKWFSLC